MNWKPRVYWAFFALVIAGVGWRLTSLITHVDQNAHSVLDVTYVGEPAHLKVGNLTLYGMQQERYEIPGVVIDGMQHAVLIVTPGTRSFVLANIDAKNISCASSDQIFRHAPPVAMIEKSERQQQKIVPISDTPGGGSLIVVPQSLHVALVQARIAQGAIECETSRQIAASPTFTDRSLTFHVRGLSGPFFVDVSALEDVDDLRFSGGVAVPLAGETARFLNAQNNLIALEWVDVSAAEERDIVLVVVGALAAISAAMAIEAIRPFIEREPD